MNYGWWPLAAAGLLYLFQAYYYWDIGDKALTISFVAYSLANLGFILDFIHKST